jgi:small subunit ribosomal protein S25e
MNNKVFLDEPTWKLLQKDIPLMNLCTISTMSEKYKIIGSLCRPLIKQFAAEGKLQQVGHNNSKLVLYSGVEFLAKKEAAKVVTA